ncbi:hypothetical protein LV84_03650 [Algoriphagus ratkowskyi]|uniref:Uncharacterized protein n=2 Tax=Algoriphagus ratkowskyi TaxID=57028 RepID=A0A2W7QV83_9BACT|nr:hypothetical protein [Algoriphagus ratkowskyi]PZX51891.1 hypothetical protein LV84_03650 [Algoriphagus ratkowskyi]TXD75980.1 hypothetical protein ESW18_17925 [Algoriphagus ratkowskyi]
MIRKILTTFLVFISLTVWAQKKIENKLTDEHQNIKGTKVSIIPPKGFTGGLNFLGLQQTESGSSIMILDIPGPYSETSKGITKENMLSKGVEMKKIETLTINGLPAIFATGIQNAYGNIYTKFIIVFGTDNETIMINGVYPENLKKVGDEIKKSMLTVFYEPDKKINPFEALDYSIDISETKLKFGKSMSNSLIFSVDGQVPTASSDKTNLIVAKSFSQITAEDKKLFCINRLKQTPIEIENIEYTNEITIDGISGYEIYAKGKNKKSSETENIYQAILFSDKLYYIIFATTNDETDKSIDEIKKAVITFKRK